jgi:hypothetical protein
LAFIHRIDGDLPPTFFSIHSLRRARSVCLVLKRLARSVMPTTTLNSILPEVTNELAFADQLVPLRLATAAKIAFPDGSMTASGLRREAKKGHLVVERIANKDYTTLEAIARMRELCRVQAREPDFTSERPDSATEGSSAKPCGSSRTVTAISPRDALRARLKQSRLAKPSKR